MIYDLYGMKSKREKILLKSFNQMPIMTFYPKILIQTYWLKNNLYSIIIFSFSFI